MAQKTVVTLVDDVDSSVIEAGQGETVTFGLDGVTYEIDLKPSHAEELRSALGKWVRAGRKARGRTTQGSTPARSASRTAAGADPAAVRAWAGANGIDVSSRGRISAKVLEQYKAAGN